MKSFFTNQGAFSIVYLVLGILLLIHPVAFSQAVCYVLGICAFVYDLGLLEGQKAGRRVPAGTHRGRDPRGHRPGGSL